MGMTATYQLVDNEKLALLKNTDAEWQELFEELEDLEDEAAVCLDIDKMWDVLHFVLTGTSAENPLKGNLLSESIVGTTPISDSDGYAAYIESTQIHEIVSALEGFDIKSAMEHFSMQVCKEHHIYPDIWDYEDEIDDIKEEITDYFYKIGNFYKTARHSNSNVLVSIY